MAQAQGISLPASKPASANAVSANETIRRARANANSLSPSRGIPTTGKVSISKEQEEFIRNNKIPVERYAKAVDSLNKNGGVQVQ